MFSDALSARELWSLKLFDTWGKIQSGYFEKNRFSLGHFTECINFRHDTRQPDNEVIHGKYCLVGFVATPVRSMEENVDDDFDWRDVGDFFRNRSMTLINGICLPATCSAQKFREFTNSFVAGADLIVVGAQCPPAGTHKIEVIDIFAISIYSVFAIAVVASTLYDILMQRVGVEANKLLKSFSAYTNGQKLFDMTESSSPNTINCLLGLRSMSVLWIMFGHRFSNQQAFPTTNAVSILQHYNHFYSVILTSYNIAVDTFFLMGALLMTISTLNALEKKRFNFPKMVLHRYLRYTPVFAALMLYIVSIYKFTLNGPISAKEIIEPCEKFWWAALLHVQNYVNPIEICAGHAWYLSADFQLFVISPLLIYPAWKFGRKFTWVLPTLALSSSIYVLIVCLLNDLRMQNSSPERGEKFQRWIYSPTHARIGPWLVGMALGLVLHKLKHQSVEISRRLNAFLWVVSLSTLAAVVLLCQPFNQQLDNQTNLTANAFLIAFHRLAWAIALSWIIFACQKLKTGEIIRWFLSRPQWQPIGRMSLSMYLVHVFYQLTAMQNQKDAVTFEIWPMLHVYMGDIIATSMLGTVLYLTFEAPILLIESHLYNRYNQRKKFVN